MERKTVYVEKISKKFKKQDYDLSGYIDKVINGRALPQDKKIFIEQMNADFSKVSDKESNFWYRRDGASGSRSMKAEYEYRFSSLFYDGKRGAGDNPSLVENVLRNLKVDNISYKERFRLPDANTYNCLELICHVMDKLSNAGINNSNISYIKEKSGEELIIKPSEKAADKESRRQISFKSLIGINKNISSKTERRNRPSRDIGRGMGRE